MKHFYACQHIDENLRMTSASGAVFPALAEYVLSEKGIVYGAAFSDDFRKVYHLGVDNIMQLKRLQGSKYIQSDVKGVYQDVSQQLSNGRMVLFSGTPCQIAGLKSYLKVDDENLICMDIVCHGVADKKIYLHYLDYLEQKYASKLVSVSFRDKKKSWRHSDVSFRFENGSRLIEPGKNNSFMRGFISNLYIRESCTRCRFKGFTSGSDLTIGDFWGSTEKSVYSTDDTGVSVVAIHTQKGKDIFDKIQYNLTNIEELTESEAFLFNDSYRQCAVSHTKQDDFYSRYEREDFDSLIKELLVERKMKVSLFKRCYFSFKSFIRHYAFS